ncbi:Serine/threonine-protein kinase haspin, partial [Coemansia thaxteri]
DEALFQGEGDIQFDVYRQMRRCAKNDWEGFYPHTNVLWLTYAFQKILMTKSPDIKHELLAFAEGKLGPTFDAVSPDLRRAAGQELLKRWIKEFEQCESTSEVLKCALLDLYKS